MCQLTYYVVGLLSCHFLFFPLLLCPNCSFLSSSGFIKYFLIILFIPINVLVMYIMRFNGYPWDYNMPHNVS